MKSKALLFFSGQAFRLLIVAALDEISLARLPVTGSEVFGREGDISFLDRAWAEKEVNCHYNGAWAGLKKYFQYTFKSLVGRISEHFAASVSDIRHSSTATYIKHV